MQELKTKSYIKELNDLKLRMLKAEKFADKFPIFKEQIIRDKMTEEYKGTISYRYKDASFAWGINRYYYEDTDKMTNFEFHKGYNEILGRYLFSIYINTLTIYGLHEKFGLFEVFSNEEIFYLDRSNSTFYIEENKIENFLEKINDWHLKAKGLAEKEKKKIAKEQLLEQLKKLE